MQPIGEVKLACHVVAMWISDEDVAAKKRGARRPGEVRIPDGVRMWVELLGIDPQFLARQVSIAIAHSAANSIRSHAA